MSIKLDREWKAALIVVALGVLAILPCFIFGSPSNLDLNHYFRMGLHFHDSLRLSQLPPGWLAGAANGYGDVTPRFYPPALFYLLAGSRILLRNWYNAALFSYSILSVLGGLGVYLWAREIMSTRLAVYAAFLYLFAPYHVNQLYQGFMLAEFAACAVLPFTFAFVCRICRRGKLADVAGLGASYALLVLTHLPLTVIGSLALGLYAVLCLRRERQLQTSWKLLAGIGLGLAASATFWVPMILELGWFGGQRTSSDPSTQYFSNFVLSTLSPDNLNVWWMNIVLLATAALFVPGIAYWFARFDKTGRQEVRRLGLVLLASVLMTTYVSWPLWRVSGTLQSTQFPWRWMGMVSLAGAPFAAAHIPYWWEKARTKARPLVIVVCGLMAMSLAFVIAHAIREANYLRRPEFEARIRSIPDIASYDMWWPIWGKPAALTVPDRIRAPERAVAVKTWDPVHRQLEIGPGASSDARVALFYYPLWHATMDGNPLPTLPGPDGAIMIKLPPNAGTVNLDFVEPPHTKVANILTILGWIGLVGLSGVGYIGSRRKEILQEETEQTEKNH